MSQGLRFAVLGDPVAHSKSPAMHRAAFAALGLPHRYEARRVLQGTLATALDQLEAEGCAGVNLTVPHKRDAGRLVVERGGTLVGAAARLQTVNTISWVGHRDREGGGEGPSMEGHATDGWGFIRGLEELAAGPVMEATVLGGGGAARCIVDALVHRWADIRVTWVSRDPASLTVSQPGGRIQVEGWDGFRPRGGLLVNATSVGMPAGPTQFPVPIELSSLRDDAVVVDIVYPRPVAGLLDQAQDIGLTVSDGRPMLLWQGVRALETWLGVPLEPKTVDAMRSALTATTR